MEDFNTFRGVASVVSWLFHPELELAHRFPPMV